MKCLLTPLFLGIFVSTLVCVEGAVEPPAGVQVILASNRAVVFYISPSSTPGVTYEVQFMPRSPSLPTLELQLRNAAPTTYTGLIPGTRYTLSVVAVLGNKSSSAVSVEFVTRGEVPSGPPRNVRPVNITSSSITITWDEPAQEHINHQDGIKNYLVMLNGITGNTTGRSYTFSNLRPGIEYTFTVLAVNAFGQSDESNSAMITATTSSERPGPPVITGVLPRFRLVSVCWQPDDNFVGEIIGYQIEYKINGLILDDTALGDKKLRLFHHVHIPNGNLKSSHEVRVRAKTGAGYGPYSEEVLFVYNQAVTMSINSVGCGSLSLSLTVNPIPQCSHPSLEDSVSGIMVGCSIRSSNMTDITRQVPMSGGGGMGQLFISGLTSGEQYRCLVEVEAKVPSGAHLPEDMSDYLVVDLPGPHDCKDPDSCSRREFFTPARNCTFVTPPSCETPEKTSTPQTVLTTPTGALPHTTTARPSITAVKPSTTSTPPPTSTATPSTTAAPPRSTTTPPRSTTASPRSTTASPRSTTAPPRSTTAPPRSTATPPRSTTTPPRSTTAPPRSTTAPPRSTTAPPRSTTAPPRSTTAPPRSTATPPGSTVAPPSTTAATPRSSTAPSRSTAATPRSTTVPPSTTTALPSSTKATPSTTTAPPSTTTASPTTTTTTPTTTSTTPTTTAATPTTTTATPTTTPGPVGNVDDDTSPSSTPTGPPTSPQSPNTTDPPNTVDKSNSGSQCCVPTSIFTILFAVIIHFI